MVKPNQLQPLQSPTGRRTTTWTLPRRILKYAFVLVLLVVFLLASIVLGIYGYYRSIVNQKPGGLAVEIKPGELGALVDPFVGTGGVPWLSSYNSPCATMPFGLVRLAPDTASMLIEAEALNSSGYYYGDNKILGFSHTRLLGADALEGGNFRILPTTAPFSDQSREEKPRFSHQEEIAFPGYYAVQLPDSGIRAELTASTRVGVHRYTFPAGSTPRILLHVSSALGDARTRDGKVTLRPAAGLVEGSIQNFGSFSSRYGGLRVYFVARFSQPFGETAIWADGKLSTDSLSAAAEDLWAGIGFPTNPDNPPIEVRVALSYVSLENARANLAAEAHNRPFDAIAARAGEAWEEKLQRIRVQGGTDTQRRIFYTSLYRAFQMPTLFNDANGEYLGFDGQIHVAEGFQYYTDFSLWDTFRTVHPLYNLIARAEQRDMLVSLLEMAKAGGCFPRWPSGGGYTNCMIGTPADIMVSEAYQKGIRDFDIETAYQKLRQTALEGKPADSKFAGRQRLEDYLALGYCPSDRMSKAVGQTLEFSYSDAALALLAKELGREQDAVEFAGNSQSYRNLWNPETQYFHPKSATGEIQPIDPFQLSYTDSEGILTDDFIEGSALQWRWVVPFDPEGLISLFKSPEYFVSELETYLEGANEVVGNWNPGPYYWHGNEPYIHSAYLFNSAGRPDLTQKWVRWILDTKYSLDYVGLDGNDDGGTLSAWYVFSSLGFYPIAGTTRYEIGSPLFDRAELDLGESTFTIEATGPGPKSVYVERAVLNGEPLDQFRFDHDAIQNGGSLTFEMKVP